MGLIHDAIESSGVDADHYAVFSQQTWEEGGAGGRAYLGSVCSSWEKKYHSSITTRMHNAVTTSTVSRKVQLT